MFVAKRLEKHMLVKYAKLSFTLRVVLARVKRGTVKKLFATSVKMVNNT